MRRRRPSGPGWGSPLIRSAILLTWLVGHAAAQPSAEVAADELALPVAPAPAGSSTNVDSAPEPSPMTPHRTTFDALTERAIGRTSKRVRYDWRRDSVQVAITGGLPAELNNFDTLRTGAMVRFPTGGVLLELGVSYAFVSGNASTHDLSLTPYRQPGRPDRLEIDFGLAYPLAEGVVTTVASFVPALELTLDAHVQLRYLLYPGGFSGLNVKDTFKAIFAGSLSDAEKENLEDDRLPGMEIDPGRYVALVGLGNDVYFQSGFFFAHRVLIATPLLVFMTDSKLDFGFEWDLLFGLAF